MHITSWIGTLTTRIHLCQLELWLGRRTQSALGTHDPHQFLPFFDDAAIWKLHIYDASIQARMVILSGKVHAKYNYNSMGDGPMASAAIVHMQKSYKLWYATMTSKSQLKYSYLVPLESNELLCISSSTYTVHFQLTIFKISIQINYMAFLPHSAVISSFWPWFPTIWEWFAMFLWSYHRKKKNIMEEIESIMGPMQNKVHLCEFVFHGNNSPSLVISGIQTHLGELRSARAPMLDSLCLA